jgi:hypothetical protein
MAGRKTIGSAPVKPINITLPPEHIDMLDRLTGSDRSSTIRRLIEQEYAQMEPITSITVELVENDLRDFLAETSDVDTACEEYRAEYERRLSAQYPDTKCRVELGETNGMDTWYTINGERTTAGSGEHQDEIGAIEHIADQVGNTMEDWLTVA